MKDINFKIKNKKWTLKIVDYDDEHLIMNGEQCIAQLYKKLRLIYIDSELLEDSEELKETITHELTHAFIMTYAISHRQFLDEEFICEFMAVYGLDIVSLCNELMEKIKK